MLHHIRRVAPTLNVPWLTPRVTITSLTSAAARFVEEDGWVRIEVDQNFLLKPAAAKAILCHEVCHYVLHASGIREAGTNDNERLTDVAIFVLGLGEVFISGYRSNPGMAYRQGHRLGYLTDGEYHYARNEVNRLRTKGELQQDETSELRQRLMNRLLGDGRKLTRYLEAAHQKFPLYNEAELLKAVEDDLDRGR